MTQLVTGVAEGRKTMISDGLPEAFVVIYAPSAVEEYSVRHKPALPMSPCMLTLLHEFASPDQCFLL